MKRICAVAFIHWLVNTNFIAWKGVGKMGCLSEKQSDTGTQCPSGAVTRIHGEDGEAVTTRYPVFPGIDILYNDVHASRCVMAWNGREGMFAIHHCWEGRIEYQMGDAYFYLAPGDLALGKCEDFRDVARFPTGHYHGITVCIDPEEAPECLSCLLADVNVRPGAIRDKFCRDRVYFAKRSSPRVEHVFSELYAVPEDIRAGYFKVKILELLLFLTTLPADEEIPIGCSRVQVQLAGEIRDYLRSNTEAKVTISVLTAEFHVSPAQIKSSFQAVYGMSPAAYLRSRKMKSAAQLLRETDRTVLDIAGQFGYDNASKFAKAFRDVIGVSPAAYRMGIDADTCAPA